jgi:hypothetical protein
VKSGRFVTSGKAAERLRRGDYYCRRLGVHLSWVGDLGGWWEETDFHEARDTGFLLARLEKLWQRVPRYKPLSVGVVLLDLVPADHHQPDLFVMTSRQPARRFCRLPGKREPKLCHAGRRHWSIPVASGRE